MGLLGVALLAGAGLFAARLVTSGGILSREERIKLLAELQLRKIAAGRALLRCLEDKAQASYLQTKVAAAFGFVAGVATGLMTLNPQDGVKAAKATAQLSALLVDIPDCAPAIEGFRAELEAIAELEMRLGLPPGIPVAEVAALRMELEGDSSAARPTEPTHLRAGGSRARGAF